MDRSAGKTTNLAGIDPQLWCRMFRRRHPTKTAEQVAARIGASGRTVENWLTGAATPSLAWFVRIVDAYGPQVLAEVMPESCGWLAAAVRNERRSQLEAEQRRLERELARLDEVHS